MDIQNIRDKEEKIGDILCPTNTEAFAVGDHIQITEKYDGSNASIECVNGQILAFSRKLPVVYNNTLNGFFEYVQKKIAEGLTIPENLVIFGEWSGARNKIVYEKKKMWLVFDIFNRETESYMPQEYVKAFCVEHGLDYIHELYNGPFISWEHCRTFSYMPAYGQTQEGIVVKNQDKLTDSDGYFYLKIVNPEFKEKMNKPPKEIDPEKEAAKANAQSLMEQIVTRNRVEKMLFKLRDDGIIGETLAPSDMGVIAKNLPRRIYEDCLKEEPETVIAAGEYAGKMCSSIAMGIARKLILG